MSQSNEESASFDRSIKATDAITTTGILPKLTPEQRQWIEGLPSVAKGMVERVLWQEGEADFLSRFGFYREQMEYVLTLL